MSLGFRRDCDFIAERMPAPRRSSSSGAIVSTTSGLAKPPILPSFVMGVPRGLIPTLFYVSCAFLAPFLFFYLDYDLSSHAAKGITIGISAGAALLVVLANDCCCWYNMLLAFHTGLEVKVIDTALKFATESDVSDHGMGLAISGAGVIILHLIPFYTMDNIMLLAFLAFAGVIVNTAVLVYLDDSLLLVVVGSALFLLMATMLISGICEIKTSLLSLVRTSIVEKKCITCQTFEL